MMARGEAFVEGMVNYMTTHARWADFTPEQAVREMLDLMLSDIGAAQSFLDAIDVNVDLYEEWA